MKKTSHAFASAVTGIALLAFPFTASAHQHAVYEIGGHTYEFVVGSLGEPIAVDDKTGVDFRVTGDGKPEGGHENTLKVELIAGDKKKTLDLSPTYNTPGSYYAKYYPTVATTLQYRIFGTIKDTPIDLTFTCRAEGAEAADEGEKEISEGVRQISKSGGFGCPAEKSSLGFPEESAAIVSVARESGSARGIAVAGLALAVIALVLAGAANRRRV
jgi:hypothetical protein